MPRPNNGVHLWLDPESGRYYARWFDGGKRRLLSLYTTNIEIASDALKSVNPLCVQDPKAKFERNKQLLLSAPNLAADAKKAGRIYVIGWSEDGPLKIGIATNPDSRLLGIQNGCPYELRVMYVSPRVTSMLLFFEGQIHRHLADRRMMGEWFDCSYDVALAAITETISCRRFEAAIDVTAVGDATGREPPSQEARIQPLQP